MRFAERDAQANHIPQFRSTVQFKHQFRFFESSSDNVAHSITRGDLLGVLQLLDETNHSYRLLSGVKLNRVEIRAPTASSDSAPLTISVEWTSTLGPSSEVSDTGTPLHPPLIVTSPPRNSLASFWSLTGFSESDVLCVINAVPNCFIDVWLDMVLQDGQSPVGTSVSGTGITVGQVFEQYLDGNGGSLYPVSYTAFNA